MRSRVWSFLSLLLVLAIPSTALAAPTPSSGTISPTSGDVSWADGPFTGSTTNPLSASCANSQCSVFRITVTGTDATIHTVVVRAEWLNPANDFDLSVVDVSTGSQLDIDGAAVSNFEEVSWSAAPGQYDVIMLVYRVVADSYTATATLTTTPPEPENEFRTANYQLFDFGFTPEVKLPEQERSLIFIDQDVEPEIEIDRFGTIYVGAIRGVGGGNDCWRSDDGGATFKYLGEPDGSQNPSPFPPSPEGGVGGGDVDISLGEPFDVVPAVGGNPAIRSTGRIYFSSLWLGSATMSVSVDRGENWAPFPFTTADLDRQWHVARGEKTLYMSLRKVAQIVLGQHAVAVVQSDDGGMTYPKGSFVQDPLGDGVPEDLGGNNVITSDGVLYGTFVSRDGKDLYLWRNPKAPNPPPADIPLGVPDAPLFEPDAFDVALIFHGARGVTSNNVFPIMAVDKGGNLHIAFSDRQNIYLMSCPVGDDPMNPGSWTLPVILNAPKLPGFEFTRTALFPWVTAGDPGMLGLIWYGTEMIGDPDTPAFEQQSAPWRIIYAQVENALAATPDVYIDVASQQGNGGIIHTGQICTRGLGCPSGTRELAEYSSLTLDPAGFPNIVYAGTIIDGVNPSGTGAITFFTKSTTRPLKAAPRLVKAECHDPRVTRYGGWHDVTDERATNDHYCRNSGGGGGDKGANHSYLEFRFQGRSVDLQIGRGPRGGNAEIFIDGASRGLVDFWRAATDPARPDNSGRKDLTFGEFVTFETGPGSHTFKLLVRNTAADQQRDMIYVDGFVITDGDLEGQGNPTEASTVSQGTVPPGTAATPGLATVTVSVDASTRLLTGVLEMADGADLDLTLLDADGTVRATAATTSPTEVTRAQPSGTGVYTYVLRNKSSSPAEYRLYSVRTIEGGGGSLAASLASSEGEHAAHLGTFDPSGSIRYTATGPGAVRIRVFNVQGRLLRTLIDHAAAAGRRVAYWNGRKNDGSRLPSGVYLYRIQHPTGEQSSVKTVLLR